MTHPTLAALLRICLLGSVLLCGMAQADETNSESTFISDALNNSQEQLARAQQAIRHGHTLAVRDQAQGVLDEHSTLLRDLQTLAQKKGLPARSDAPLKQATGQAPSQLDNSERFDHDYAQAQLKSSQAAVAAFDRMSKQNEDADLQRFARLWLPMLYHQREIADQLVASQTP